MCIYKWTPYFKKVRQLRPDRALIKDNWIQSVIDNPLHLEKQEDGRVRCWGHIEENNNKILRVVLLEDMKTVHNAFFDRRFKL